MTSIKGLNIEQYTQLVCSLDLERLKLEGNSFRPYKGVVMPQIHTMRRILDCDADKMPIVKFDKLTLNLRYIATEFAEEIFDLGYLDEPVTPKLGEMICQVFLACSNRYPCDEFDMAFAYLTFIYMKLEVIGLFPCKIDSNHRDLFVVEKHKRPRNCPSCQSRIRPAADLVERFCEHDARRNVITNFCGENFLADYTVRNLNRARKGRGGMTGKQPNSPEYYTKTAIKRHEATILSRYFSDVGLLNKPALDITEGHLFITVFETYLAEAEMRSYGINRAFYLLHRLRKQDIVLVTCSQCGQDSIKLKSLVTPSYCAACDIELRDSTPGRRPQTAYFTLPESMTLAG